MKITCDMKAFRAALAVAGKVVATKSTIPILTHVRLATNDDRIAMDGTNLDTSFEATIPAEVAQEGAAGLSFATLAQFCAAAKAESLTIEAEAGRATLKAGRSRITLATAALEDFPRIDPAEGELVGVDGPTTAEALRFCASAASDDAARPYLQGVYVEESEAEPVCVWGSDGFRVHRAGLPGVPKIGGGGIVPTAAVQMIVGVIDRAKLPRLMVSGQGWHVAGDGLRLWGKVIKGSFPDIRRVIAGWAETREFVVAERTDLASVATVAGCGAETHAGGARAIVIRAEPGAPVVMRGIRGAAGVVHAGRGETEAAARAEARIVVASPYLADAVGGMGADALSMQVAEARGAGALIVTPAQKSATIGLSALIMGIRASEEELADV